MNPSDYRAWMARAFLFVEGSLLRRAAEESPSRISEDFVRQALIDGLKAAQTTLANSVGPEVNAPWNRAPDVTQPKLPFGKGRSKQHDIGVTRGGALRVVCELKWLKTDNAAAVMEDLWRLALTHGVAKNEKDSCRTFLLVGGMKKPFQKTLTDLHRRNVPLRWSPQGKADQLPRPTRIRFGSIQRKDWGFDILKGVLKRRKNYHRQPPVIWRELRCVVVARHWKTIRGAEWKVALWELDFRKPCKRKQLQWHGLAQRITSKPKAKK